MRKLYFISLILVLLSSGCKKVAEEELLGTIYGVVTDKATGEPVRAVGVELSPVGLKTVTGTEGQFEFTNLTPGNYTLRVTKTGYADLASSTIAVKSGQTAKGDVQIIKLPSALRIVNDKGLAIDSLDFGVEESINTRSFSIFNDSPERIEWLITENSEWIVSVSKTSGSLQAGKQQPISITIDREKLSEGNNIAILNIISDNGSKELIITAMGNISPSIYIQNVYDIGYTDIRLKALVLNSGYPSYIEKGFIVSKESRSSIDKALLSVSKLNDNNNSYEAYVDNLLPGTEYFARAYITSKEDTVYSENEIRFVTDSPTLPEIRTLEPTRIYENGAVLHGYVISEGDPALLQKGFLLSASGNIPELNDEYSSGWIMTTPNDFFLLSVSNMKENTEYYVRSFAITPFDTVYGNTLSMETHLPYKIVENLGVRIEDEYMWSSFNGEIYLMTMYEARTLTEDLVIGPYENWRLPTLDELKMMYLNRMSIGGFAQDIYWSSTQNKEDPDFDIENSTWGEGYVGIDFSNGKVSYSNPYAGFSHRVRVVRSL